jgi:hypothetical protein
MLRVLILVSALLACGARPAAAQSTSPDVLVTLAEVRGGEWVTEYRFRRSAPAWLFRRSANTEADGRAWRPQSWTVETPGVRIERRGPHDVLVGGGGALKRVRIRIKPYGLPLRADYVPVLTFSDGGQAHYADQYLVTPLRDLKAADQLPFDLAQASLESVVGRFVVQSDKPMLVDGKVWRGRAETDLGRNRYVYVGRSPLLETEALAAVVDPGLPSWLKDEIDRFTPALLAEHARRLGPNAVGRPTIYAGWGGTENPGASFNGGALPGLIILNMRGAKAVERLPALTDLMRWFLAHEAAHFWLGETIRVAEGRDGWITEGGADLLAIRALQSVDPQFNARAKLQSAVDDCMELTGAGEALRAAPERGEHRAQYACGSLLLLAAEAGLRKRQPSADAAVFWGPLIEGNRKDGVVGPDEWLAAFEGATSDPALTIRVREFLEQGAPDTRAFLRDLFDRTGVAYRLASERITLQ